jgi:hypothetical protein
LALTNLTSASALPFVSAAFGAAVDTIEPEVTGQPDQVHAEHCRAGEGTRG